MYLFGYFVVHGVCYWLGMACLSISSRYWWFRTKRRRKSCELCYIVCSNTSTVPL